VVTFGEGAVYKDIDSIPLGVDFRKHLEEAVARADVLLAIIGPRWLAATDSGGDGRLDNPRDFVRIELATALVRGIPVIPVLVSGARMPGESDLPEALAELAYRHATQIRPDPDFHSDMDRLVRGLQRLGGRV
jgi:hypothetical protein